MTLIRGSRFPITTFLILVFSFGARTSVGAPASVRGEGASVETVTTFSTLDGGASDLDGIENGVFTVQSMNLHDGDTIVLDVPNATFDVAESVTLRGHSAIRVSYDSPPEIGPRVTIHCGGPFSIRGDAKLNANGANEGGRIMICSEKGIELRGNARISADGIGPESRAGGDEDLRIIPGVTFGGDVRMESSENIRIVESARVSVNGSNGGSVRLISCHTSASAIEIRGAIRSLGEGGVGGPVDVEARQGGVQFDDDDLLAGEGALSHALAIVTEGSAGNGVITVTAAGKVDPNPPPTSPAAVVTEDAPSAVSCDSCFQEDPNDCDGDGVPNAQEIVECDGDPSCDDCNLNDVPDGCDIAYGESADVDPADGVPDECFGFIAGGCFPPTERWSCFDNWALPGDSYPDDVSSAPNVHVTLGNGDTALLDVDATIPTLRLLKGAILRITNDGPDGDLNFSLPAKVLNLGTIFVSGNHNIGEVNGLPPLFIVGPGGLYAKEPSVSSHSTGGPGTSAGLTVSDLILEAGRCTSPPTNGAELRLDDSMRLQAARDVYLRGSSVGDCLPREGEATVLGGVSPPPKLNLSGGSSSRIGSTTFARNEGSTARVAPTGNLHLEQIVEVSVQSTDPLVLLGDFDNRSIAPDRFDWLYGGLSMEGTTPQAFEVAGRDVGSSLVGIFPTEDSNFAMGKVRVASGADVTFRNGFSNTIGAGACQEAVYVRELVLEPGSHVTLDNCRVYYAIGSTASATVDLLGCGALVQLVPPAPRVGNDVCVGGANANRACGQHSECPGGVCQLKNRFASLVPAVPPIGDALPMGIKITAASVPASSVVVPAGVTGQSWWVQTPTFDITDGLWPAFDAAPLSCSFAAHDLSETSLLHVYGPAVVPGSSYDVQICTTAAGPCSAALRVDTAVWADIVPPFINGQPTFQDIMAVVNRFMGNPTGPSKTRVKLSGLSPDPLTPVNFGEVATAVDAFKGKTFAQQYPLGPSVCP